jgi:Fe-S cluster assembly protein SufD
MVLGENAVLDHYTLEYEGTGGCHVGAIHLQAERSATCTLHAISTGGALIRNDVVAALNGEGVDCTLNGLYLVDEQRLVDNHTTIDHAQPHCASRELYKGILADRARGVFNGKIIVRPDAQKTDAKQTNRALLLSEDAQINTKPQLEIFANDVKCTHGAAVGQLDDEALFYLRSRGLGAAQARRLLIHAFAADVLSRLRLESVRAGVENRLQRQLAGKLRVA